MSTTIITFILYIVKTYSKKILTVYKKGLFNVFLSVWDFNDNNILFQIFEDNVCESKPYYKETATCAKFLCNYYNFTIEGETKNYILDYLKLSETKIQEIKKLLYVSKEKETLFRKLFEYVLSDYYPELSKYTSKERLAAYSNLSNFNNIEYFEKRTIGVINILDFNNDQITDEVTLDLLLKKLELKQDLLEWNDDISFFNLWDFICFCISHVVIAGNTIKKCKNCGKFFTPANRIDEIYCDYEYKDGKTCKEIGYLLKVDKSEILKEYRKVYKTKNAWKNRNKKTVLTAEKEFEKWHKTAKIMLEKAQSGKISDLEFLEWLRQNK